MTECSWRSSLYAFEMTHAALWLSQMITEGKGAIRTRCVSTIINNAKNCQDTKPGEGTSDNVLLETTTHVMCSLFVYDAGWRTS